MEDRGNEKSWQERTKKKETKQAGMRACSRAYSCVLAWVCAHVHLHLREQASMHPVSLRELAYICTHKRECLQEQACVRPVRMCVHASARMHKLACTCLHLRVRVACVCAHACFLHVRTYVLPACDRTCMLHLRACPWVLPARLRMHVYLHICA